MQTVADIIPVMTADDAPSPFVASASTAYSGDYYAYKAFNQTLVSEKDRWLASTSTGWLKIDCGVQYIIDNYDLQAYRTAEERTPRNFTLQGSNNDSDWTILDTQTGITWSASQTRNFVISGNSTSFRYYKLNVTSILGGSYVQVGNMQLAGYIPKSAGFFAFFCESWQRRSKLWRNNKLVLPKDLGFSY